MRDFFSSLARVARAIRSFLMENSLEAFPIRKALARYSWRKLRKDSMSGLNVALLAIPQGLAFAVIAGLDNVAFGILCTAVAATLGPLFASSRHTVLGPTNATALILFSAMAGRASGMDALSLLVFLAGIMLVLGAYLRMADLLQFISRSVVVGYVTGAGFLIFAAQLKDVLGGSAPAGMGGKARTFFSMLTEALTSTPHGPTIIVSSITLLSFVLIRRYGRRLPTLAMTLLLMSVVVAIGRSLGIWQEVGYLQGFNLSHLAPSIPSFRDSSALDQIALLFGPAFALAFTAALENSVMSKSLASRSGDRPDANQDLLSLGIANLATAFVSHMPASGSPTRSTLNFESGAVSQVSSIICGLLCLAGVFCLGDVVSYIPRCSLAVLVIIAAVSLIHRRNIRICLRATRSDASTLVVTVISSLIMPLHVAIFVGVATSVALYLRKAARPMLVEYEFNQDGSLIERNQTLERQIPQISIVHVEGELFFGAAELFLTQIQRTVVDPNLRVIILRMKNARHLDATSVMALEELVRFLRSKNRHLIISGASKEVYRVLKNAGMIEIIGRENFFMGSPQNPNLSTRNALKRAQALLGTAKADVRIFYDPSKPRGD